MSIISVSIQYKHIVYLFRAKSCSAHKEPTVLRKNDTEHKNNYLGNILSIRLEFSSVQISSKLLIFIYYMPIYMFKVFKSNSWEAVGNHLNIRRPQHQYNTGNRDWLITPFPRVNAITFNFQYQFTNIWNKVKDEIKNSRHSKCSRKC